MGETKESGCFRVISFCAFVFSWSEQVIGSWLSLNSSCIASSVCIDVQNEWQTRLGAIRGCHIHIQTQSICSFIGMSCKYVFLCLQLESKVRKKQSKAILLMRLLRNRCSSYETLMPWNNLTSRPGGIMSVHFLVNYRLLAWRVNEDPETQMWIVICTHDEKLFPLRGEEGIITRLL